MIVILKRVLQNQVLILQAMHRLITQIDPPAYVQVYPVPKEPPLEQALANGIEASELRLRRTWVPEPVEPEYGPR